MVDALNPVAPASLNSSSGAESVSGGSSKLSLSVSTLPSAFSSASTASVSPRLSNYIYNNIMTGKASIGTTTGEDRSQTRAAMSSSQLTNLVSLSSTSKPKLQPKKKVTTTNNTTCSLASPDDADTLL